jgi:hypothetical protein
MSYKKEEVVHEGGLFFSGGGRTAKEDGKIENKTNDKCMALCVYVLAN